MKSKRVLLVFPEKAKEFTNLYPPLGLCYIASSLKQDGHEVKGIDLRCQSYEEYNALLRDFKPDWVGVSVETVSMHTSSPAMRIAKEHGSKVVVGGPHASIDPIGILEDSNIDVAVIGEGEEIIREVVGGRPYDKIQGIAYRKDGKQVMNPHEDYVSDLDRLPMPDRSIFPVKKYFATGWIEFPLPPPVVTVFGGRGCPFSCTFCAPTLSKIFGPKLRFRSPQNMIDELHELVGEYSINGFYLVDDLPTANPKWIMEFSDLMVKSGLNKRLAWSANTRSNIMNDKLASKLKRAGCVVVYIGIESGSQKILDFYRKGITVEDSRNAARICRKHGLIVLANLMFGAPIETKEDLEATYNLFKEIDPEMARTSITSPLPGTYLHDDCVKNGSMCKFDYRDYSPTTGVAKMKTLVPMEVITDYQNKAARYIPRLDFFFKRPHYRQAFMRWLWAVIRNGQIFKVMFMGLPVYLGYLRMRAAQKSQA